MQSILEGNENFIEQVRVALRQLGKLLPTTDKEVEQALKTIESEEDSIQVEMSDPYHLFRTGRSESPMRLIETPDKKQDEVQDDVEQSLALAARKKGNISKKIRERMDRDRKHAERDSYKGDE